ncbi:hypothetical protein CDAR_60071 [Caerostris darwini]|uniref:Uncharacterized protein n=1 Tax=Caerostris darwini TaxID=1538125 RepID=A0AAV4QJ68_9ARAC|nr:hypothetical protein CDAR_60071 [Caerostris darwini]
MKSIRREWECGSSEEQSWWFCEQSSSDSSSSKTGVAPSYYTFIPSPFPYAPPYPSSPFSNHSVKKRKGGVAGLSFCWRKFLKSIVCIRDFSNPNGRKEWKCGSPEEQSWGVFEQSSSESSSSKTGVAPSSYTVIPSRFPYPPTPSNHSVEKIGVGGCPFAEKNS